MQHRAVMTWKTLIHGEDQTLMQERSNLPLSIKRLIDLVIAYGNEQTGTLFSAAEIEALVPESDWAEVETTPTGELQVWASGLAIRATQQRGSVPPSWNKVSNCRRCGPVWSDHGLDTLSCGWCEMRDAGKWFPRP